MHEVQAVEVDAAVGSPYLPTLHAVQALVPVGKALYAPAAQGRQTVPMRYDPEEHSAVDEEADGILTLVTVAFELSNDVNSVADADTV